MSNIVAIIPARSKSKGVPDKNIIPLNGIPLISYSIQAAKLSTLIDKVIVSTDSLEYAEIAKKYGADVPFIRPEKYARDDSNDIEFLMHFLEYSQENYKEIPDIIVHL